MKMYKKLLMIFSLLILVGYYIGCQRPDSSAKTDQHTEEGAAVHETHNSEGESSEINIKPEAMKEAGIEVKSIQKTVLYEKKTFPSIIVPRIDGEALVGTLIEGRVVKILAGLGSTVKAGTPLCQIESTVIGEAQSTYISTLAENEFAQKDLVRQRKLRDEQIGSEKKYLEVEAEAQAIKAKLKAAENSLYSIGFSKADVENLIHDENTSGILTLKSPIQGTIVERKVRLGQRVTPEDNIFQIVDLSRLWVKMSLYENDLTQVKQQQEVVVIPQSNPTKTFPGKIVRIGDKVDSSTRIIECFAEVNNRENILIPNLFVSCTVKYNQNSAPVLAVPNDAVVVDEHGDQTVFLEHEPNFFILRELKVGRSLGGWTEVLEGLQPGDRVVFKGAFFIKSEAAKGSFGHGHQH